MCKPPTSLVFSYGRTADGRVAHECTIRVIEYVFTTKTRECDVRGPPRARSDFRRNICGTRVMQTPPMRMCCFPPPAAARHRSPAAALPPEYVHRAHNILSRHRRRFRTEEIDASRTSVCASRPEAPAADGKRTENWRSFFSDHATPNRIRERGREERVPQNRDGGRAK